MTFKPGNTAGFKPGQGGRAKGARNIISTAFLEALAEHFQEEGHKAIEICFHERPVEYLKIVASILPKELEVTNTKYWRNYPMQTLNSSLPTSPDLSAADLKIALRQSKDELTRRRTENKLAYYRPYPKQREFHAAGANHRERLLMAGNQTGKTLASAMSRHARNGHLPGVVDGLSLRPRYPCLGVR